MCSSDAENFQDRVNSQNFSNSENTKTLDILKKCISKAKENSPTDEEIWGFCKVFVLLLFDMDCEESINRSLSSSLIKISSNCDATMVWSKLVEYAGRYNQAAADINLNNIDSELKRMFSGKILIQLLPTPIEKIDLFLPIITLIGSWQESNEFDQRIIQQISNMEYSIFIAKAREMRIRYPEYIQLNNGTWKVLHKQELLEQCKNMFFDDILNRLIDSLKIVLAQNSKRVMCKSGFYVSSGNEYDNSNELRMSLVKSICLIKKKLPDLSNCSQSSVEHNINNFVYKLLNNTEWMTWGNLKDCLMELAELAPDSFLDCVEAFVRDDKREILNLFPQSNDILFNSNNCITELLWSLEVLAWSPDYLIRVICILGFIEYLPYQTSWSNTPINSIVSILLPWYPQTLANPDKRKNALNCLEIDNSEVFWIVLGKLLPGRTSCAFNNPKPRYLPLVIPEKLKITNVEVHDMHSYLLDLAVTKVTNDTLKQVELVDQLGHMTETTLNKYLECLEVNVKFYTEENAVTLWIKLRECIARIKPTEKMVIFKQKDRILHLIEDLEPTDSRLKYQELYKGNFYLLREGDYSDIWEQMEKEKIEGIRQIFNEFGIQEAEHLGNTVGNSDDVAYKLGCSLSISEMSSIIQECSDNKVSVQFVASCISSFINYKGTTALLETSLINVNPELALKILIKIPYRKDILEVISKLFDNDSLYWKKVRMPIGMQEENVDKSEMRLIVNKLMSCKRYVTAINVIGRSNLESKLEDKTLYKLLKFGGTKKSFGNETIDSYAINCIFEYLHSRENIDITACSEIEFIYLPILIDNSGAKPRALYTRLSQDSEYFCNMIELYFKKNSEKDHSFKLNKELSKRRYEVLGNFKVVPGTDWYGKFDGEKFKDWMNEVKRWSLENDRYKVTMHTVGSGLSYGLLNEEGLPDIVIMAELNMPNSSELREGYQMGIVNQRGVYFVDPDGTPETQMANDYLRRADAAENKGYSRFAKVLREISDQYFKEAKKNIESCKESDEE